MPLARWLAEQWREMDADERYDTAWALVLALVGGAALLMVAFAGWGGTP